jgi:hypothetical protein
LQQVLGEILTHPIGQPNISFTQKAVYFQYVEHKKEKSMYNCGFFTRKVTGLSAIVSLV